MNDHTGFGDVTSTTLADPAPSLDDWEAAHRTRIDTILADHGHSEEEGETA